MFWPPSCSPFWGFWGAGWVPAGLQVDDRSWGASATGGTAGGAQCPPGGFLQEAWHPRVSTLSSCEHRSPSSGAGSQAQQPREGPRVFGPGEVGSPPSGLLQQQNFLKLHFLKYTCQYFKCGLPFEHLSASLELSDDEMHMAYPICHGRSGVSPEAGSERGMRMQERQLSVGLDRHLGQGRGRQD